MTVIAACVDLDGVIWMGGDAISLHRQQCVRVGVRSKVFRRDAFVMGGTGTVRVCQILEHLYEPPQITEPLYPYMVSQFANGLRAAMKEHGGEISNNNATEMDGRFLVGIHGQLFEIDSGYGVFSPCGPYLAIGCAAQEAMAGMFIANDFLRSGEEVVLRGLLAAAEFDINIRPPFTIISDKDG